MSGMNVRQSWRTDDAADRGERSVSVRRAEPAVLAGRWDAVVTANKVDVPFAFEVAADGSGLRGSFYRTATCA